MNDPIIFSQDRTACCSLNKFIFKVLPVKDLELTRWELNDSIYPWCVVVIHGDNCEIFAQYETKEQAIAALSYATRYEFRRSDFPSIENVKKLMELSDY